MSTGRKGSSAADERRLLAITDLEQGDLHLRAHVFKTPSKDQTSVLNAMQMGVRQPKILIGLSPRFAYSNTTLATSDGKRRKLLTRESYNGL